MVPSSLQTDSDFVVLHGDNAQGKTSVLEAVHVLATLKSFREPRARRWIQIGQDTACLRARVCSAHDNRSLQWRWVDGERTLKLDDVPGPELTTWFSAIRAVVFCPEDIAIVRGEPGLRRRFLDRAAFTLRPGHLQLVQDYRKVLRHKVALLKQQSQGPERAAYDAELARIGARLIVRRREAVAALRSPFRDLHKEIAGQEVVEIRLKSRGVAESVQGEDEIRAALESAIAEAAGDELQRAQALIGPHRDELDLRIDGKQARNFASQGQARSVVLALKLAQWSAAGKCGDPPLFLLDDLGSELDSHRRGRLLELLGALPGQVWVTTTDLAFIAPVPGSERQSHRVSAGGITPD
jgi:DNA replication and repair protein RecF